MTSLPNKSTIRAIAHFFEERTGQTLSESRMWRIETALRDVLRDHGLTDLVQLHAALEKDVDGRVAAATIHAIMNHESSFFRDLNIFEAIENQVLPHLHRALPEKLLRIWCAGCSTGQEVYSLAIILKRQEHLWKDWRVSIVGTDVSPFAIGKAQSGIYPQMDVQRGLPIADLLRWFEPAEDQWQVSPALRPLVNFRVDNVLDPRSISGSFDLVMCRNVLLYFPPAFRAHALNTIARFTRPESLLVLGAGETTIGASAMFAPSPDFRSFYQRAAASGTQPVIDRIAS